MGTDFGLGRYFNLPRVKTPQQQAHAKAMAAERARSAGLMRQAHALAARFGVKIEREHAGAYWVTLAGVTDTPADPLDGNHFCTSGCEVLAAVETYAVHQAQQNAGSPVACVGEEA